MFQRIVFRPLRRARILQAQAAPPSPAGTPSQDSTNDLSVTVGKTVLVDCAQPIARVAMGMGDIAEATAVSPTEIMVNGKAPGETSLIIWDIHGGRQFFNVTVRPRRRPLANDSLDAVRRELRTELPGQTLKVNLDNNSVFLRGTVKDLTSSDAGGEDCRDGGQGGEPAQRGCAGVGTADSAQGALCQRGPQPGKADWASISSTWAWATPWAE